MTRIVIIQPSFYKNINGNFFYLEEIGQCLKFKYNIQNVFIYGIDKINYNLTERYTKTLQYTNKIMVEDVLISDFSGLGLLLQNQPSFIDKIKYLILMNSATTHLNINNSINSNIGNVIKNIQKFYLLVEESFYTGSENHFLFKGKIIHCKRGFYFNNYKEIFEDDINSYWYCHNVINGGVNQDHDIIDKVKSYCPLHNIQYTQVANSFNPAHKFKGLLYIRNNDYMPRLPYEFWYYNKPVIFFDISDGLLKRYTKNDLILKQPIIKKDIPVANFDELLKIIRIE